RADDVGEEHGDDLSLLARANLRQRRAARVAEASTRPVLLLAAGTGRHAPSVGRSPMVRPAAFVGQTRSTGQGEYQSLRRAAAGSRATRTRAIQASMSSVPK